MSVGQFLLALALILTTIAVVKATLDTMIPARVPVPVTPTREPVPQGLQPFWDVIDALGYHPEMQEGVVIFPYPVRGGFVGDDNRDRNGVVCTVNISVEEPDQISTRVWLPKPIPRANRARAIRIANQLNQRSLLGSWNVDEEGGCWFNMWTFAVEGRIPVFVPEAIFGQIESAINAGEMCEASFGLRTRS